MMLRMPHTNDAAKAGTHFSLPLALGTLSPQRILQELQRYEDLHGESKSSYWIKFELLWREFFYFTQVFSQRSLYFVDAKTSTPLPSISLRELLVELCEHELIRAMLGELVTTGVLSNRCRQIFASHFVHLNRFDWRYGAYLFQYFYLFQVFYLFPLLWNFFLGISHTNMLVLQR